MSTLTDTQEKGAAARRVDQLLAHYGESHRNPRNELIHFIAIPLIVLSLLGLLFAIHPAVPYVVIACSLVYYARLSVVFLLSMAALSALMMIAVHAMGSRAAPISATIFIASWIAQFIGHKIEGKKPSFFEDLQYLLVGPLFVLSKLFEKIGLRW